ncbi:Imm42 family immunity protein [Pasteurella multocida]|uniref:Imm42 family immunity protein n=1 Tax=Pasteurella multocida TaxID=747 RepID=UPI003D675B09
MLIGDPYSFAIRCDVVEAWNNSTFWINGIFEIYIHGKKYPNVLRETSLEQMFLFLFLVFRKK